MAILKVANIWYDSTGTNKIEYQNNAVWHYATGGYRLPVGNTAQRPSANSGMIRYNNETGTFEGYNASAWGAIGGAGGGATLTEDTANTSRYVLFSSANTGTASTINVASTKLYFNPNTGTLSATIFNSLSDENKKKNVKPIKNALSKVMKLKGVGFDWVDNGNPSYGLIAQEVEKIIPEIVIEGNGEKSLNYDALIAFLVNSIHQLNEKIKKLENGR